MFYNDSYSKIIGPLKHPRFFGTSARLPHACTHAHGWTEHSLLLSALRQTAKPGQECFPEIWHIIGPMVEYVRTTGDATWVEDQLLHMNRNGYLEVPTRPEY